MTTGTKRVKNIVEVSGVVTAILPPRQVGKCSLHPFVIKQYDGVEINCNSFDDVSSDLVGKDVKFKADHSEQYNNFTVQGKIAEVDGVVTPVADTAVTGKASGRAAISAPASNLNVASVHEDLESVREAAESIIKNDVKAVKKLLGKEASADAIALGVQALQALRATLFIEGNKRARI